MNVNRDLRAARRIPKFIVDRIINSSSASVISLYFRDKYIHITVTVYTKTYWIGKKTTLPSNCWYPRGILFNRKTGTWATFDPAYTYTWTCPEGEGGEDVIPENNYTANFPN